MDNCPWCTKFKASLADEKVQKTIKEKYIFYPINVSSSKDAAKAAKFGVSGMPTVVLIDKAETLTKKHSGYFDAASFNSWLQ